MSHYAEVENGVVQRVIVADRGFIDRMAGTFIQCSYNTRGGAHALGGTPLRKNFPGIGFTYDEGRDAFIAPQPAPIEGYGEYTLNEETCLWEPPAGYEPTPMQDA